MTTLIRLRRLILFLYFSFLVTSSSLATAYRVNGNAEISADFRTLQQAHDASSSGDTLYIEGFDGIYSANLSKKLVLLGPGFFTKNIPAIVNINFLNGSEESYMSGMTVRYNSALTGVMRIEANNITIAYNLFPNGRISIKAGVSGLIFIGNHFIGPNTPGITGTLNDALLANNIFFSSISNPTNCTISNNIFRFISTKITFNSCEVFNNIFLNINGVDPSIELISSNFTNNLAENVISILETYHSDNLFTDDAENIFVYNPRVPDLDVPQNQSRDGRWMLQENSIAKGAGLNGEDLGVFGGDTPYILSGKGGLPFIENLFVPAAINKDNGLKVRGEVIFNK